MMKCEIVDADFEVTSATPPGHYFNFHPRVSHTVTIVAVGCFKGWAAYQDAIPGHKPVAMMELELVSEKPAPEILPVVIWFARGGILPRFVSKWMTDALRKYGNAHYVNFADEPEPKPSDIDQAAATEIMMRHMTGLDDRITTLMLTRPKPLTIP